MVICTETRYALLCVYSKTCKADLPDLRLQQPSCPTEDDAAAESSARLDDDSRKVGLLSLGSHSVRLCWQVVVLGWFDFDLTQVFPPTFWVVSSRRPSLEAFKHKYDRQKSKEHPKHANARPQSPLDDTASDDVGASAPPAIAVLPAKRTAQTTRADPAKSTKARTPKPTASIRAPPMKKGACTPRATAPAAEAENVRLDPSTRAPVANVQQDANPPTATPLATLNRTCRPTCNQSVDRLAEPDNADQPDAQPAAQPADQPVNQPADNPSDHTSCHSAPLASLPASSTNSRKSETASPGHAHAGPRECVICLDAEVTHALVPCGHKIVCAADAPAVVAWGTCPWCRVKVQLAIQVY